MSEKIKVLSPEQWARVEHIKADWLNNASKSVDRKEVEKAVNILYGRQEFDLPLIVFCDSPLTAILTKILLSSLDSSLGLSLGLSLDSSLDSSLGLSLDSSLGLSLDSSLYSSLDSSLGLSLYSSLDLSLRSSLGLSLYSSLDLSLRSSLDSSLDSSLYSSLRSSLRSSLDSSLRSSLRSSLDSSLRSSLRFYYWQSWVAFYQAGDIAGVKYDQQKYNDFQIICKNLSFILPYEKICIVAAPPIFCGWSDDGEIHSEDRASVEYADGFKIWAIEGYLVPESLVMHPELQTIEEINNEQNEEIKRIRINRYGWDRYLTESNAEVLDFWTSPNGYLESLMKCGDYKILCTYDPSTGRPYSLEVDPSIDTCERAQNYLLAPDLALAGLGIECVSTYPSTRT